MPETPPEPTPPPPGTPTEIKVINPADALTCSKCSTTAPVIVMGYDYINDGTGTPKYRVQFTKHPDGWHFIGVDKAAVCPACIAAALA